MFAERRGLERINPRRSRYRLTRYKSYLSAFCTHEVKAVWGRPARTLASRMMSFPPMKNAVRSGSVP